jgi:hypothetical protein
VNGAGDSRNVDRSRPRGAHPRGLGLVLLTGFLTAATVPALHSWARRNQERQLQNRQGRLDRLLQAGSEDRRDALPERDRGDATDGTSRTVRRSVVVPVGARRTLEDTLVSPPSTVELFRAKGLREGEFERSLKPPATVTCSATRDGIDVRWERPADLDAQLALLRDLPLLMLGFRVYRWREGEEPRLVSPLAANETSFTDRDLPLWRVRFFYCVATVIEGTIGDLPTLIESKRSPVMKVETTENFKLEVEGVGADKASVALTAWLDGSVRHETLEVAPGQRIVKTIRRDSRPFELDTGSRCRSCASSTGRPNGRSSAPSSPDGRRKLDPLTGRPAFTREHHGADANPRTSHDGGGGSHTYPVGPHFPRRRLNAPQFAVPTRPDLIQAEPQAGDPDDANDLSDPRSAGSDDRAARLHVGGEQRRDAPRRVRLASCGRREVGRGPEAGPRPPGGP